MPSPKLIIRRIVVDGELSLDQKFYPGLNIIQAVQKGDDLRSTNGCGKTSLVELIQHGFGKTHESKAKFHFASIIKQLKMLWLEFETESGVYTIQRSLNDIFSAARFYEGGYVPGMENTPAEAVKIEDMSQLLLRLTGIPEVNVNTRKGVSTPLSFRLLMRAFILHQEDSFAEILFKVEPESRKADVIGFLTGITPLERFPLEETVGQLIQQQQSLENYVDQVTKFLLENKIPSLIEATARVEAARNSLDIAREEQKTIQRSMIQREVGDRRGHTDTLRNRLMEVKQQVTELEQSLFSSRQEEERLKELSASLRSDKQKSRHLQASSAQLSHVEFDICPRCLQDITVEMHQRESSGRCSLCNRPLVSTSDSLPKKILKTDDLDTQIEETEEILISVQEEIGNFSNKLSQLKEREAALGRELESQVSVYVSPAVDQLIAQADAVSERQAELASALHFQEQAQSLEALRSQLDKVRKDLAESQDELEQASKARRRRRQEFSQMYFSVLKAVNFPKLQEATLNPQTLMPNINGELYIHQGTALKGLATVCYHLALLNLARAEQTYFPKMLIIDSPNVGDLNAENHTRLLDYIAEMYSNASSTGSDGQIILTTRLLPKGLKQYVRDTISNPDRMLLRRH